MLKMKQQYGHKSPCHEILSWEAVIASLPDSGERDDLRGTDALVAGQKRDVVDDTGGGYQFVCRIGSEVEPCRLQAHRKVQRPHVEVGEGADDIDIGKLKINPSKLDQLCQLPKDNR
jgi:hypothetical protein